MEAYPFIFSNEPRYRLRRHLAFWIAWWMSQSILYAFAPGLLLLGVLPALKISSVDAIVFLLSHMFITYGLMYFVIPKYVVKGRYVQTILWTILLALGTGAIAAVETLYVVDVARYCILGKTPSQMYYNRNGFFLSLLAGLRGGLTIAGLAAAIKLMKYWYVKQARNLELQKENIAGQLQLLKAQVHPHFLFNTLNNVYAHAQVGSASAPVLIAGLSDLLRYMLYEGNQAVVPFEKELKMIKDYFVLEQVRYGNKLDVNLELPDDTKGLYIAPLLLLPFVENCFKHGASHMLDQPWISMRITVEEDRMKMKLLNGKAAGINTSASTGGIGIANVMRRLDLLYPQKHQLNIKDDEDVFIVNLQLQLERRNIMIYEHTPTKYHPVSHRG
ncbi:MAG TPA: histidine kinase [Puia sp.]|nr:histidine kinase [Puia sp.]